MKKIISNLDFYRGYFQIIDNKMNKKGEEDNWFYNYFKFKFCLAIIILLEISIGVLTTIFLISFSYTFASNF